MVQVSLHDCVDASLSSVAAAVPNLGRHGNVLSQARSQTRVSAVDAIKGDSAAMLHFLAVHHVSYWVSYQPATRHWIFQGSAE